MPLKPHAISTSAYSDLAGRLPHLKAFLAGLVLQCRNGYFVKTAKAPWPHTVPSLQGQYDRVHCGAACPTSKLGPLLDLLRPEGGLIVTPVEPSDLRVIIKKPDGAVTSRIISQVRYSTLEVGQPAVTPMLTDVTAFNPSISFCASSSKSDPSPWRWVILTRISPVYRQDPFAPCSFTESIVKVRRNCTCACMIHHV